MHNGLDCIDKAVEKECGRDAAKHQVEIDKRYLQPMASEINCDLGSCHSNRVFPHRSSLKN